MTVIGVLELPVGHLCQSDRCLLPSEVVMVVLNGIAAGGVVPTRWLCGAHRDELMGDGPVLAVGTGGMPR